MTDFPPLHVAVSGPRQSCVIDVSLALASGGLLFSLRLAKEANVFFGRDLWQTLDSLDVFGAQAYEDEQGDIKLWKLARVDTYMNQLGLFWVGESRQESLLPENQDKQFLQRYETLAKLLDAYCEDDGETWLAGDQQRASVDTLALAGALMPYRPIVFTSSAKCSPLLSYIQNHFKLTQVSENAAQHAREYFRPLFFRNGISDLLWHGLKLTAVHLVAPHALVMPTHEPNKVHYDTEWAQLLDYEPCVNGWEDAAAYWYSLDEVVS